MSSSTAALALSSAMQIGPSSRTACLSVQLSVKLALSHSTPLPCGPLPSLRPIIDPCMHTPPDLF